MPSVLQPAAVHPAAQRAGGDGEHDVVDGAAERVLDRLEVVELASATKATRRCGPISTFSGELGAGRSTVISDLAEARRRGASSAVGDRRAAAARSGSVATSRALP